VSQKLFWWPEGDATSPSPGMAEFDVLGWPDTAPFLNQEDVCVLDEEGNQQPSNGARSPLSDWVFLSFQDSTCSSCVIEGVLYYLEYKIQGALHYHHMSEAHPKVPLKLLVEAWNTVMKIIGYKRG